MKIRRKIVGRICSFLLTAALLGSTVGEMGTVLAETNVPAGAAEDRETLFLEKDDQGEFDKKESVREIQKYPDSSVLLEFQSSMAAENFCAAKKLGEISGETERIGDTTVLFSVNDMETLEKSFSLLDAEEEILYYQPDYVCKVESIPSDPYFYKQWGLKNDGSFSPETSEYTAYQRYPALADADMKVTEAWDVLLQKEQQTGTRKQVVVAVLDTGIDIEHEDLKEVIWTNEDEIVDGLDNDNNGLVDDIHGWNFYSGSNSVFDSVLEDEHGTHVAGIIGAQQNAVGIAGVASAADIKIMPVKCMGGKSGTGSLSQILQAVSYAEENGADIVNMSFGFEGNPDSMENRLFTQKMSTSELLFVTAAGNGDDRTGIGFDITYRQLYPACCDVSNVITVANLLWNGRLDVSSNYSARFVDVAAPGMAIYSTLPSNQYGYMSGTSMAAPMVSGVAALIEAYYDKPTAEDIRKIINATVLTDSALEGKIISGGIPDAYAALTSQDAAAIARKTPPEITLSENYASSDSYVKQLHVEIKDAENDIVAVCGAYGQQEVSYFEGGSKGSFGEISGQGLVADLPFQVSTTYTIYAKDKSGYETVQSYEIVIKEVSLKKTEKTLKVGKKFQIQASLNTQDAAKFTYSSSKKKVATVNKKGVVKAKKKGRTKITVSTPNGKEAVLYIQVK